MESFFEPRIPSHEDITKYPINARQQAVVVLTFFFPVLSLVVFLLRGFDRIRTRQWGLGMLEKVVILGDLELMVNECR